MHHLPNIMQQCLKRQSRLQLPPRLIIDISHRFFVRIYRHLIPPIPIDVFIPTPEYSPNFESICTRPINACGPLIDRFNDPMNAGTFRASFMAWLKYRERRT